MKRRILACFVVLVLFTMLAVAVSAATPITTAADLKKLMDSKDTAYLEGDFYLTNDIDMSSVTGQSPIGEVASAPFAGTFEGNGYTISGLNISISAKGTRGTGLFGHLKGGEVQNLSVDGSISVTSANVDDFGIGGIAGFVTPREGKTTRILNCANYCTITTVDGESRAGGIAGAYITRYSNTNFPDTTVEITNCVNYGTVTGKKHLAGIIGRVDYRNGAGSPGGTLTISGCANYALITPDTSNSGADSFGGMIGTLLLRDGGSITVKNCINEGVVKGGCAVGGIVGRANLYASATKAVLLIENCVNLADISSTATASAIDLTAVGGIVGQCAVQSKGTFTMDVTVNHCYNAGKVTTVKNKAGQILDGAIIGQTNGDGSGTDKVEMRYETTNDKDVNGVAIQNWRSPDYTGSSALNATQDGTSITVDKLAQHSLFDMSAFAVKQGVLVWNVPFTDTDLNFLHDCSVIGIYTLQNNKAVCPLCNKELLSTQTIDGEVWIELSSADDVQLLMNASRRGDADALGYNYIMTKSIDISDIDQYPIGQPGYSTAVPFTGKFDGAGYTISGILLKDTTSKQGFGLFGTIGNGFDGSDDAAVVKNLTIDGTVDGFRFVGALVGMILGNAEITDCATTSTTTVTASGRTSGGLIGAASYNIADYTGGAPYTVTIEDCTNAATVKNNNALTTGNTGARTGGIIGQFNTSTTSGGTLEMINCTNTGTVTGVHNDTGGVIGYLEMYTGIATLTNCTNAAKVQGRNRIGGVIGYAVSGNSNAKINGASITVEDCANSAAIVATGYVGGVIGEIDSQSSVEGSASVIECLNTGKVTATDKANSRVGGVVGYLYCNGATDTVVERCVNTGEVVGFVYIGGVAALSNGAQIIDSINTGAIGSTSAKNVGGIVGWATKGSGTNMLGCLSMGSVSGAEKTNLLIGYKEGTATISGCTYMKGISGTADNGVIEITADEAQATVALWCITCHDEKHDFVGETCTICEIEKCDGTNHARFGWDVSGTAAKRICLSCCTAIDASDITDIYVSAKGKDYNLGTEDAPIRDFTLAMDIAALAAQDVTVHIVGVISPSPRQIDSESNTFTNSFEEKLHTNTITITGEGTDGELRFTNAARRYFLYGPTTFEHLKLSKTVAPDNALYIFGRGFALTMGEGLTMVDTKADDPATTNVVEGKNKLSKTDAAISGLGVTTYTSDMKAYVYGGFYKESDDLVGGYKDADMETYHSNLTVLSGEYWTVASFNRGFGSTLTMDGATAELTIGDITAAYVMVSSTDKADFNNTTANVRYVGPAQITRAYRFAYDGGISGSGNTVNYFFYAGSKGLKFGDFGMGAADLEVNVNHYYATSLTEDSTVLATMAKNGRYPNFHAGTVEFLSFPEYCLAYRGGHSYVNNVCSFCDVKKCDGATKSHTIVWDTETGIGTCMGECGTTFDANTYTAVYVSDSGRIGAAGTKDDPFGSYRMAVDVAASANKDMTIYLVGTVTLQARHFSGENNVSYAFEEADHRGYKITVTSESTRNKGTLKFTDSCYHYYLFGDTTFKNINITSTRTAGNYIFGRGFKLVMDTGLTMKDIHGKTTTEKTDANIDGFGTTVKTSDIKMYVFGGFFKSGSLEGFYTDMTVADMQSTTTDITVLSGEYWTIGGGSRGTDATVRDGMHVTMTIGAITSAYIVPLTSDKCDFNNTTVDIHYTGKFNAAYVYRFAFDGSTEGSGNVINHFFHKGAGASKIGDTPMGPVACPTEVNLYYATSIANIALLNGFREKSDKYAQSYNQVGEEMSFPEWCVEHAGGHDWDANNVCSFCEITPCTHVENAWTVLTEPTCVAEGLEANRCTVCFEHLEERVIAIDPDAHDIVWTYGETSAVAACTREGCGYSVTNTYGTVTEIHVSGTGSLGGDFSAENPISDFGAAMAIAAAQTEDVTVYIHDIAIIPDSGVVKKWNAYVEPEHDNKITITSYGDTRATLRFNGDTPNNIPIVYALSGPTTFEDLEFSSWNATSRFYIVARHNALVLGEGLTSDYQRGADSGVAGTDIIVIGGCYYKDLSPAGGCEGLGADLTVLSGTYGAIIGGAYYNNTCCVDEYQFQTDTDDKGDPIYEMRHGGDIRLTLGGDVMIRRQLYAGSYGNSSSYSNMNNIYIDVVGNITVASQFGFGPYGVYYVLDEDGKNVLDEAGNKVTAPYMAKNVYLTLRDGEINGGSFFASNDPQDPYVLGAVMSGDATTARIAEKLYVYADISNRAAKAMYDLVLATLGADEANDGKWKAAPMDESYCEINYGEHTDVGTAVPGEPSTCTVQGYETHHCSACGDYIVVLPLAEHNYDASAKITIAATCIAPEMEREVCTACGSVKHTITGNELVDHTDPEKTGFCQVCNKDLTADCEHTFGEAVSFKSGCGDGTKRTCSKCGKVEVEVFGDGHNYGKYVVTVEPTETMPGIKTRTCKGCGKVETALLYATDALNASAVATDAEGNLADFAIENAKLTKGEKAALNTLLQQDAYGSEVKISYETDGKAITNITYSIPVPAEYTEYENVRIVVRDDDGKIHFVDFQIEKGYIVFTF